MENILEIKGLCKRYRDFALQNISLAVPKGVIMGFIGENGAGKTTTIRAILNLIQCDAGEIAVFGLDSVKHSKEIKEKVGVVLDDSFFSDGITPKGINLIMQKLYKEWSSEVYYNYLKSFSLPENKTLKQFSSGMKMKLKLAVALSHNAQLLILDEPTSGLDPVARADILDILRDFILDEEHSVFISTHITSDLEHIADYITFIEEGRLVFCNTAHELLNDYGLVRIPPEQVSKIDKADIVRLQMSKYYCTLLTNNRYEFKRKYGTEIIDRPTLEDIMVLYAKGEPHNENT